MSAYHSAVYPVQLGTYTFQTSLLISISASWQPTCGAPRTPHFLRKQSLYTHSIHHLQSFLSRVSPSFLYSQDLKPWSSRAQSATRPLPNHAADATQPDTAPLNASRPTGHLTASYARNTPLTQADLILPTNWQFSSLQMEPNLNSFGSNARRK